jgi:hypothetical protein
MNSNLYLFDRYFIKFVWHGICLSHNAKSDRIGFKFFDRRLPKILASEVGPV